MPEPRRILFVCLGNIVRSPLAESLFRHLAAQRGLDHKYEADSAGTASYHVGEPPDPRMRQVAKRRGLDYDGRARQVKPEDLDRFDLILAMDRSNLRALRSMARTPEQRARIRLLREFDPEAGQEGDVPDPYYGGMAGFEETYRIIERSLQGLLEALEREEA